jgi:DNA-binding NarL/FixJ family response regulator
LPTITSSVRRGLRALFESEPDITVVGEAGDGLQALDLVAQLQPDVMVLDLVLPDVSRMSVLKQLTDRHEPTRVVVLSMHAGDAYVAEALRYGAFGYVVKDASAWSWCRRCTCRAASGFSTRRCLAQYKV